MRLLHATAASLLGLVLVATVAAPAAAAADAVRQRADVLVDAPIAVFLKAKAQAPPPFDWTDDGCSHSPDRPFGFEFGPACKRHDFGYRNYGQGLRLDPTETRRARIDARFHADLVDACGRVGTRFVRAVCERLAWTYYQAVRMLGRGSFTRR